ncbi:MAG: SPL family radical SAM protein [Thermoplasmata archaeon]
MRYIEIMAKTALSKSGLEGTDYSLNPYTGCQHACVYCYAPYVLRKDPREWADTVYVKKNVPQLLIRELKTKKGAILISSVTDPYQPAENTYFITRHALEILKNHDNQVSILTKSALILRDIELIEKLEHVQVGVSFSTFNETLKQRLEPYSSSVAQRLEILHKFAGRVTTYAMLAPITTHFEAEMESILKIFRDVNVSYIILDQFRRKEGMPDINIEFLSPFKYMELRNKFIKKAESYGLRVI